MTYLILDAVFLVIAFVVFAWRVKRSQWGKYFLAIGIVALLTVIFDNAIIASGIVAYDVSKISGVMIGVAPIEDFAYAIAAVLAVGAVKR